MKPIILNSQQAQELHTTGRLTGYREKCGDLPAGCDSVHYIEVLGKWIVARDTDETQQLHSYTPPRDTDTAYAVKEPALCMKGNGMRVVEYGGSIHGKFMPDWAVRQHARITDRKLIIHDGELWWDFGDLENVG